jgi:hypothetical protein
MEHVTLREVIDRHDFDELDAAAVLDRAAARVDTAARREAMRAAVVGMLAGLEECVGRARECSRLATRASRDARALDELGRAERRLSDAIGPLAFLSMMSQSRIRAAQEQAARAESLEQNLAAAEQLFAVIGEAGRKLVEPLRRSLDALSD